MRKLQKNKIIVAVSFLFIVSTCLFLLGIKHQHDVSSGIAAGQYPVTRRIKYGFTFYNRTNRTIKYAGFFARIPVKQTGTQNCLQIQSSYPGRLTKDKLGNQIIHYVFSEFPPFTTRLITLSIHLALSDRPNNEKLKNDKMFIKPEKYIESENPEIKRLGKKLKRPAPLKTAENIFQWVADNIKHSGYLKKSRGALYTSVQKRGDCTELAYLFTALCRADNIHARCIAGYICKNDGIIKPAGYHNWAQFYHDGAWRIADPYNRVFMKNGSNYIAMQIIERSTESSAPKFNRFMVKGKGITAKMNL